MHPYLRHLRLPFNLLLAPIYLWGVLLAGGTLRDWRFWAAFVSLHFFLYGGATAFNSYYDRDEGPVGGMAEPPPVDEGLLRFSLVVQALGFPLALAAGWGVALAWLIMAVMMAAYSHPATRWKARPVVALVAVALGQGAVGFAAGWLVARPALASLAAPEALLGMAAAALLVTGLYVVTQSYQTAEDRARGDRTLPVILGPRRALLLSIAIQAVGGGVLVWTLFQRLGAGWALCTALLLATVGAALLRWALRFDEAHVMANFRTAMRIVFASSTALSAILLVNLLLPQSVRP